MSNDLYQRQLEKAQKRLEHSSNCLAGLTKDRNAAVLSKKARKKLYKEYSDSIVKNIASGTDVAVNRKHLEKLAEKHSKHKKDVLQGNCLSAPLLEDVLQNEETESKAENWCSWEPEALPETMPDSMLQDNCPRMEEKSANKVALPMRVPEPAIKKAPKAQSLVELAGELKKYVHIISYGNILYYHNEYYYTQLDSNQLIKLYRQNVDYELNNKSSLRGYTGTSILRPEWSKLYRVLKEGDTVVFDSVSRMSRNAEEGFSLYEALYHKGIRLVFLKEHHIDTETYKKALSGSIAMTGTNVDFILKGINEYLMTLAKEQIKLAFEQSEKEVADLHQRTREGLVTAKLNGKQVGRKKGTGFETKKSKAAKEKIRIHCKAFGGTLDDVECMKLTGLARNTYYKYKRQIREEVKTQG